MDDFRVGAAPLWPGERVAFLTEAWRGTRGAEASPSPSSTCWLRAMFRSLCSSYTGALTAPLTG
eukprot:scaffold51882_cov63-Phaeocystis_antarctica.AAC.2